jgi:hypothetical protein
MQKLTIRAMNGKCPIPLPRSFGTLSPSDFELYDWFHQVRDWGMANGCPITKEGIIQWLISLDLSYEEQEYIAGILQSVAPSDQEWLAAASAESSCSSGSPSSPSPSSRR